MNRGFSKRTGWDLEESAFSQAVKAARLRGPLADLTVSNPTQCGFEYSAELLHDLAKPSAFEYVPEPFGMVSARDAVAAYYADHKARIDTARICLTTSTSEAYSFLFRLLCDPGDEVLIARPSYPLFEYLATLDSVRLVEYSLHYDGRWFIDRDAVERAITPRTKALIVVHPNNPTGNFCTAEEMAWLQAVCSERGIALIADEVFLDYALQGVKSASFAAGETEALTFVLSGISKVCALPQMKCSWIAAAGPSTVVDAAMRRLEVIADTFLSMNAPVQHALPGWLENRELIQAQIRARMHTNVSAIDEMTVGSPLSRLGMDAGWTAVLRVPRVAEAMEYAEAALERGVLLQPGEFYGLAEGRIVVSLLTQTESLREGIAKLLA